jgi:peptidoglycan/xylan/chitin deacetylase (PgdA/CDA1 family)
MGAEKVTRRVLLTAGGLTLLGIYAADPSEHGTTQYGTTQYGTTQYGGAERTPSGQPAGTRTRRGILTTGGRPAASAPSRQPRTSPTEHPQLAVARPGRRGPGQGGRAPLFAIDDGPKAIALTIDDGPSPVYTPQVLRLLARYRITATFSMIGIQAQAYPAVAREVAEAGHLIANHTWTHRDLQWLPPALVTEQITRAADAIHAATGRVPGLFRAPYGAWSPFVLTQCAKTGLTPLGWSVDPRDWSRPGVPAIVANIMRNTRTGSIILEHDGGGNRAQTVAALKIVIPRLVAAGYHFRTP